MLALKSYLAKGYSRAISDSPARPLDSSPAGRLLQRPAGQHVGEMLPILLRAVLVTQKLDAGSRPPRRLTQVPRRRRLARQVAFQRPAPYCLGTGAGYADPDPPAKPPFIKGY